jgi:predicted DNA-binding transcriptional regulator YafY
MPSAVAGKIGREATVKLGTLPGLRPIDGAAVGAACLVSSLGSALRETNFREPLQKLVRELAGRCRAYHDVTDLDRKFWFVVRGGECALPRSSRALDAVLEAILHSKKIRFSYEHFDGRREAVTVKPLTFALHEHQFYVICSRDEEPSPYPYRFARMSRVEERGGFVYPTTGEYDPPVLFRDTFGIFIAHDEPVCRVRVRLAGVWTPYVSTHRWHESQTHVVNTDSSVDVLLSVRVCPELRRWVLGFGSDAEVIEPVSLRREVRDALGAAARGYAAKRPGLAAVRPRRSRAGRARPPRVG